MRVVSKLSCCLVPSEDTWWRSTRSAIRGMKTAQKWVSVTLYGCRWHTAWVAGRSWKEVWRLNTVWLDGFCVSGTNVTPVHSVSAPESPSRPSVAGATPVTSSTSSTPTSVVTEPSSGLRPSVSLPSYSLFPSFAERWVGIWCHAMTLRILLLLSLYLLTILYCTSNVLCWLLLRQINLILPQWFASSPYL
jgi:hypothetical protein